ncbi:MAG: L-2-amino-thiazoline-4-carboxylic acid hydrolase [Ilumatobacteraceae bacterium]
MWRYDGGGHRAEESLWLPDGLGYLSPPTVVSASVALSQHMAGSDVQMQLGLAGWSARAEPDPRDTGLWFVQLWLDVLRRHSSGTVLLRGPRDGTGRRRRARSAEVVTLRAYRGVMSSEPPVDHLNDVGVLKRREIEARIVAPLLERLAERFGPEVYETARDVIVDVAREQGAALAERVGDDSLPGFAAALGAWSADGALESEVREVSDEVFAFDVTRCRYAEMYRSLGLADLGATMSCNRDGSLIEGFNPDVEFTRTRTIMSGADHCDFRFELRATPVELRS